ncbi:hypothetical protein FAM18149_03079 [Lacticaseibacillus paracasei]|uniref:hypothetical protein n=1 Tax=Lacticaseibacillus paracasei TaxID=1597 RepID=UPI000F0B2563|nr:hypothetical protein [Lacticaseibacillus paracasei]RND75011.1 hypothetical protein FAM18149_03079 [Lacticaseibacillus paracasei]
MSQNEELARQILIAYANGKVDLSKVPELQKIVKEAVAAQMAYTVDTTDLQQKQADALKRSEIWLDEQAHARLDAINPDQLKQEFIDSVEDYKQQLDQAKEELKAVLDRSEAHQRQQFWRNLMPILAGSAVCLLLTAIIFFVLEKLIYQGIWNGWGLRLLTQKVIEIQPNHPYGAGFLGVIGLVALATAIYASFWLLVRAVRQLVDFQPSKLLFWRKHDNPR